MSASRSTSVPAMGVPKILHKCEYPGGATVAEPEDLAAFGLKGTGCLQQLLAMVSDCCYHYELDDDFHDGDMKLAYLTMKRAWESGGDEKPFLISAMRNRKVLNWAMVMTIWCFVLPSNNKYWDNITQDLPEVGAAPRAALMEVMTRIRDFRNEWKALHEAKSISHIMVSFGEDGWVIRLTGKPSAAI